MKTTKISNTKTSGKEEFNFFLRSGLKQYRGKYVAIVGKKVIAWGTNAKEVWQKALKKSPHRVPTLAKLPREEVLVLVWR